MPWYKLVVTKTKLPRVVIEVPLLLLLLVIGAWSGEQPSTSDGGCLACLQPGVRNRLVSGGWNYATYPHPSTAVAHRTITIADLKGPGQINTIHFTGPMLKFFADDYLIVMEIFFDGAKPPAVSGPRGGAQEGEGTTRVGGCPQHAQGKLHERSCNLHLYRYLRVEP